MRKSAVLLVAVLAGSIVLGVMMLQSLVIVQRIATVSEVTGPVYVMTRTAEHFEPLGDRQRVAAGTAVKTGPEGGLTLNWVDGSRVRLGPNTAIRVRKCTLNTSTHSSTSLFDLDVGRIWVRLLPRQHARTRFEVRTPTATAGVHGTVFSVAVDASGATDVAVYEGHVEVSGKAGAARVGAGQEASASHRGAPAVASQPDMAAWDQQVGIVGPRLDLDLGPQVSLPAGAQTLTVSGVSEPGARVTINGTPVALDRRNRFAAEVPIATDTDGMVVVGASDARGATTVRAIATTPAG